MHKAIKEILDNSRSNDEKIRMLQEIKNSIEIAEKVFSGEFTYCKKCGDYFLSKSYFTDTEVVTERVCTFSDPNGGSGDEYENKKVRYTYKYCPKGCKHIINREEYW